MEVRTSRPSLVLVVLFIACWAFVQPTAGMPQSREEDLPNPPNPDSEECGKVETGDKFDCYPEGNSNAADCEARGCCWIAVATQSEGSSDAELNVPYCFYPPSYNTYKFVNVSETPTGLEAYLKRIYRSAYPDDVEEVKMIVKYETKDRLHVKLVDPLNDRFEPPYPIVPVVDKAAQDINFIFELDTARSGFRVLRKSDNSVIFDSNNFLDFTFADQFLQVSSRLPSDYIYGVGEHTTSLLLDTKWQKHTLWNRDLPPSPDRNLYGSHPFYLLIQNTSDAHGVFLLNSNAMDILLQPTPAITFRTIGGVLDFYFFLGPTPADVIAQYTEVIGRPSMPPYWGLGFHLCRYGYKTLADTQTVMENNIKAGIPLDTQWNDLDYMQNQNDFTYDKNLYGGLPEFVDDLHKRGMHWIPLVDPGISGGEEAGSYPPYDVGIDMDVFIKDKDGKVFVGKVWNPTSTVWPDFTHPNALKYWTQMLKTFYAEVTFDGLWIDMNEPSNFWSGTSDGCPTGSIENPPYVPGVDGGVLNTKTVCSTAKQYGGRHYDLHNLYGISEADVTNQALAEVTGKRPIIISRSTFSGQGVYSGHWSGDIFSTWDGLKQSIPHLLSFSLYGIPLMGADICGFNGDTDEALCNRWHQLGAFYPFSRNHNANNARAQDPVSMGDLVVASAKKALLVRYALLPYLYTLFYRAHVFGETVARPLFFEFYEDVSTLGIETEFLWGGGLLIAPVLEEDASSINVYLPEGVWYDYYTKDTITSTGEEVNINTASDTIPLFVRGGYILPQQEGKQTTAESRSSKLQLLVALDKNDEASGELFWDDGESLDTINEDSYTLIDFTLKDKVLTSENVKWKPEYPPNLGSVTILGVTDSVSEVTVNGEAATEFRYDSVHKYLTVDGLDVSLKTSLNLSWK